MGGIFQDLRYALRLLRGAPAFAAVAALTLGLGIGANAAMVGLFDALLVRPPAGVHDPGRLVRVMTERPARLPGRPPQMVDALSYPHFSALKTRARGFAGVAAFARTPLGVGQGEAIRNEEVVLASGDYFALLGVRAALGRLLQPDDDRDGAPTPVAVLSWDYWRRAYGGDPGVLGRALRVGDQTLTVVGVAPRRFVGTELGAPAMWAPLGLAGSLGYDEEMMRSPHVSWLGVVGRVAEGMSVEQATATAQSALLVAEEERATAPAPRMGGGDTPGGGMVSVEIRRGGGPAAAPAPPRVRLPGVGGAGQMGGPPGRPGGGAPVQLWYLAVTGAVLLIACANVANLLLARGAYRAHELAVRLSMGATPGRIGRQLLTESAVLALLGGVVGFVVALGVWRLLPALIAMPPLPSLLDARTLLITAALTLLTVVIFGVAPLLGMRRSDIRTLMGRSAPNLAGRTRGRSALVVVQLAVSVVLLIGAGLFVRSFQKVRAMDLGFDRAGLLEVTAPTRGAGWTPERAADFWESAEERVARLPGVRAVSRAANAPYLMRMMMPFIAGEDSPTDPGQLEPNSVDFVDEAFFATMGVPILEGRAFGASDRAGGAAVAVVSESFARDRFRGASAVGQCIRPPRDRQCIEVVGVAGNARFGELTDESPDFVYQPLEQAPAMAAEGGVLHVRLDGDDGAGLAGTLRRELRALGATSVEVRSIDELLGPQMAPWRAAAILLSIFGGMGLLLAAVGLYGVVAFLVARRTKEIGIRMALGATRRDVLRAVLGDAGRLVGIGAGVGLVAAAGATRLLRSALYGVSTLDPVVYAATVAVLVAIALLAALSPARRAVRVDPMVALRME